MRGISVEAKVYAPQRCLLKLRYRRRLCLLFLLCLGSLGCQNSLPATVTGQVSLDGKVMAAESGLDGTIMFYPVGGGAAAYGTLKTDGTYEIQTGGTHGLAPGEYVATVRVVQIEPPPPGGYRDAPSNKLVSPKSYEDRDLSELKVNVAPGKNQIDLEMTTPQTKR